MTLEKFDHANMKEVELVSPGWRAAMADPEQPATRSGQHGIAVLARTTGCGGTARSCRHGLAYRHLSLRQMHYPGGIGWLHRPGEPKPLPQDGVWAVA